MKTGKCKGMRDLKPETMTDFRRIEGIFRECCSGWGYREVRTPTIEYLHLFTSAGTLTPGMLGRVYSFLDWDGWSGERVVLRPDGTIPVARLYIEGPGEPRLARYFYATNVFIFEETGKKARERWQCGAELIGVGSPLADAELIALCREVLRRLGIDGVELRLSHAGLVRALLLKLGLTPEEQGQVFDQMLEGNGAALARVSRDRPELAETLLPLLGMKGQSAGSLRNLRPVLVQGLPEAVAPLDHFLKTVDFLDALDGDYRIDIASGAGFEYYTGMVFQLFVNGEKVGGGGRYDALIPAMGGGDVPAAGFALYVDRLMGLLKPGAPGERAAMKIAVKTDAGTIKEAFALVAGLREAGYTVEIDLGAGGSDRDWTIEVRKGAPTFAVTDAAGSVRFEAGSVAEIIGRLERAGAGKNRPA